MCSRRFALGRLTVPILKVGAIFFLQLIFTLPAMATQGHGQPEGLYAHQMAHLFFIFSMGVLIYWLQSLELTAIPGWRLIQFAALFFILWNVNAYAAHYLEEQLDLLAISRKGPWLIEIQAPDGLGWLAYVYYVTKLDHLFCVPALIFMYLGLKRLQNEYGTTAGGSSS